jgi:hypothetical protein
MKACSNKGKKRAEILRGRRKDGDRRGMENKASRSFGNFGDRGDFLWRCVSPGRFGSGKAV